MRRCHDICVRESVASVEQTFDNSLTICGDGDTVEYSIVCLKCAVIVQTIKTWPLATPQN